MKTMHDCLIAFICALLLSVSSATGSSPAGPERIWFLNHLGTAWTYKVSRFNDEGQIEISGFGIADPASPVRHYFQPSAVRHDGETFLFVVGNEVSGNRIYLFTSVNSVDFINRGAVYAPATDERNGITQANVTYDPSRLDPFIMYYLVRGPGGPGNSIAVATSTDGFSWQRHGAVLTADGPDETHGISVGYACQSNNGKWILWYNGFDTPDLMHTVGKVAFAANPLGPFGESATIVEPDGLTFTLARGSAGNAYGVLATDEEVPLGIPMVIDEGARSNKQEVVVPVRQEGVYVHFERPLVNTHVNRPFHSGLRNKILPTYVRENTDGTWLGIFTLFGAAPGLTTEYTTEFVAPDVLGPWVPAGTGLRFKPWFRQGLFSTENPSPLIKGPSCSQ